MSNTHALLSWAESVSEDLDLSPSASFLLWKLIRHADIDTLECFPSIDSMAKAIRSGRRTVFRALDELTRHGLIQTFQRKHLRIRKLILKTATAATSGGGGVTRDTHNNHRTPSSPLRVEDGVSRVRAKTRSAMSSLSDKLKKVAGRAAPKTRPAPPPEPMADQLAERYRTRRRALDPDYELTRGHVGAFRTLAKSMRSKHVRPHERVPYIDWLFQTWPEMKGHTSYIPPIRLVNSAMLDHYVDTLEPRSISRKKVANLLENECGYSTRLAKDLAPMLIQCILRIGAGKKFPTFFSLPEGVDPTDLERVARMVVEDVGKYLKP